MLVTTWILAAGALVDAQTYSYSYTWFFFFPQGGAGNDALIAVYGEDNKLYGGDGVDSCKKDGTYVEGFDDDCEVGLP